MWGSSGLQRARARLLEWMLCQMLLLVWLPLPLGYPAPTSAVSIWQHWTRAAHSPLTHQGSRGS